MAIAMSTRLLDRLRRPSPSANGDGGAERPFRAELFSIGQLERHAKSVADWHKLASSPRRGRDQLLRRLDENEAVFVEEYQSVTEALQRGRRITPATEWFLDNYHLIEDQIRTARRHLPRGYSLELPRLAKGPSAGLPRVYDIALELISHVDGRVDAESVQAFVTSYESVSPLRIGELWAIPIMLRLALLENLRRVVLRVAQGRADAERASYWVEQMLETAGRTPGKVVLVLARMVEEDPPLSSAFVAEFASRLHSSGANLSFPISWLEQRLSEQEQTLEQVFQQASQDQAANQVSIGNSITSLRFLGGADWRQFVETSSAIEYALRREPAGVYPRMDFATRDRYRHAVEEIARRSLMTEEQVAAQAVELAKAKSDDPRLGHVGYFLIGRGRRVLERAVAARSTLGQLAARCMCGFPLFLYVGSAALIASVVTGLILWWSARHGLGHRGLIGCAALLLLCTSQLALALVQWVITITARPKALPRMDFSKAIPPAHRTVVVVPTLLTDIAEINGLIEDLEVRFLANRDPAISFALLADFRDAPQEAMSTDAELLEHAKEGIAALNAKYERQPPNGGFFLFHRPRRWNERERVWMGWERKRGKLEEFNAFLRGGGGEFLAIVGPVERLSGVKYVITLDTDTQLPRDAALELIETMAHPLNRPRYDPARRRVVEGYGILQPRVAISMPSAGRSRFAQLFSGEPGIDPYTRAVSDVYQDVFEEGSYIGKGIYDIDSFGQSVGGQFPENSILSHDLLEGSHARAGLISDVLLIEEYPAAYPADVSRRHRWIRGDWQITPWLLPRVLGGDARRVRNPISSLSRWKIFDNIRRSLIPILIVTLLVLGWFLPGGPLFYTLVVVGLFLLPPLLMGLGQAVRLPDDFPFGQHLRFTFRAVARQTLQEIFALACLPYDAYISLDAIARTLFRLHITRRKLLQWQTARDAQGAHRDNLIGFYRSMWALPATAITALAALWRFNPRALPVAAPILAMWLALPWVAWWLSQPIHPPRAKLSAADFRFLFDVARRTWRYFDTFVALADNYLPPDNYQEDPPQGIAHRTSPTNIGLGLLSNLAGYDFGFIALDGLLERTKRTLDTMDRLQRYRGHFFNWYDTRTLEPIRPLYVSAVDSGNLAGHLLTLAAGLTNLAEQKIVVPAWFSNMNCAVEAAVENSKKPGVLGDLRAELQSPPRTLSATHLLLQRLAAAAATAGGSDLVNQCRQVTEQLIRLAPWVDLPLPSELIWRKGDPEQSVALLDLLKRLEEVPTLAGVAQLETTLLPAIDAISVGDANHDWFTRLRAAVMVAAEQAARILIELHQLALRCRELADVDYDFLYDPGRRLLAVGYNVSDHRMDASFYDLLASEARLASFIAIAQGKLPQEHWFSLGRLLTSSGGRPALLSWNGSMFEYLMPLLVMPTNEHTLLDETYRAVVARQIEYGRGRDVPWGISESGYSQTDGQFNYQYRAFGVPGLGFKRGLGDDLVIAPYASAMALMVAPESSCANLRRLAADGQLGAYGFYEAIDYTPTRLPPGQRCVTVRSFMSHHQGMSLLGLAYLLLDRPMQRRFESDPAFRSAELLLHERVPKTAAVFPHPAEVSETRAVAAEPIDNLRIFNTANTPTPEVHLLSNGRYHVALTAAGGGYSRWKDLAVTRWHEDAARDCWGSFCYLRDVDSGEFWSTTYQPTLKAPSSYEVIYSQGRAEFRRRDGDIDTRVEMAVSPEDDIELRRITLANHGERRRTIELTSYAEVVLSPPAADAAHPAFSNLFVRTQIVRQRQAILCTRRPRSTAERPPWMLHLMTVQATAVGAASYETGRSEFIGRGRTVADPAAMHRDSLTGTEGAVLDPIAAIRTTLIIGPDETVKVNLVTGVCETEQAAMALIEKYHDHHLADRVFELAWTHSQVILRQLDATEADTQLYSRLASSVLYSNPVLRAPASVIARNHRGQSGLWGYGISGDLPIVLLKIGDQSQINLVRQLVAAHAYWRVKGLAVDLVIWNDDLSGYRQALNDMILGVINSRGEAGLLDKPGGIFVRRGEQISEEDKVLFQTVARIVIIDTAGTLPEQAERRGRVGVPVPKFNPVQPRRNEPRVGVEVPRRDLTAFNGFGGFTRDGREYVITSTAERPTPAPWVNVLANANFGTVVSDSGAAYTWSENACLFRLTPWYNDPVGDSSGEAFYVRDEESGRFWSPTSQPAPGPWPYTTRHGFGYTIYEYSNGDITTEMLTYVATDAPVKFVVIKAHNLSGRARRISLTAVFDLVLGDRRAANSPHVVTESDPKTGALLARNSYNGEFANRVAFLDCSESRRMISGDRVEILGRNGRPANPACMGRSRLSGRVGAGLDPCAAMQATLDLAPGQETEVAFMFGCGADVNDARNLINRFRGVGGARAALDRVWEHWKRTLGVVHVETPDASLNFLANGWLLYQVLACRVWARSGFYQSGGAYGFRDQLQDVCALVHAEPGILREHLLRCAGREFKEGDVQHWWHPPSGRGVRTRISDDSLWLPFAVCRYITSHGDTGVLEEKVHFLEGRPVKPDEDGYYEIPARSDESATLYDHCVRTIRNGLRFGEHGLPLMGTGDWNDGMNLVGEHGKGESVWLAFFLYSVLTQFAPVARQRRDVAFADLCVAEAAKLKQHIAQHAWDGQWYRRAYFDNGEPLGSSTNPECQIDSLPQSWSVLSGAGENQRSLEALRQLDARLVDRDLKVIKLFDPPFDQSDLNPGYVKGYVPGVRENGGQYTHAAVWAVMAFAEAGDVDRAWELFNFINPVRHGDSDARIRQYKVEPYVVAGDVYTNLQHAGRGGWTWYTGSAGWMYRLIIESLLGLKLEVDRLRLTPLMPKTWDEFKIHYKYRDTFHHITVHGRGGGNVVKRVVLDGVEQPDLTIPLVDDHQEHHAEVEVGADAAVTQTDLIPLST
jgi:cyclic beta-1,2-glucan synthetase